MNTTIPIIQNNIPKINLFEIVWTRTPVTNFLYRFLWMFFISTYRTTIHKALNPKSSICIVFSITYDRNEFRKQNLFGLVLKIYILLNVKWNLRWFRTYIGKKDNAKNSIKNSYIYKKNIVSKCSNFKSLTFVLNLNIVWIPIEIKIIYIKTFP